MRYGIRLAAVGFALFFAIIFTACAGRAPLKTGSAAAGEVQGTYDLILFGANHSNDIATVAILDRAGDGVSIEPHAPLYAYKVRKGLTAKDAVHDAEGFISWHHAYRSLEMRGILDASGAVIGYEMRPLYRPIEFGATDVLDISYTSEKGRVTAWIRLIPSVEKQLFDNGPEQRQRD